MFKVIIAALSGAAMLSVAGMAAAQSTGSSNTRTTTTVTRNGDTTTTTTNSRTRSSSASFDAEAALGALGTMLSGANEAQTYRDDRPRDRLRRLIEPARTEDVFGEWVIDDGGRDARDCRLVMNERAGFLGTRSTSASEGCPRRLASLNRWSVQNGQLVFWTGGTEGRRLDFAEGRFYGDGLVMVRPDDTDPIDMAYLERDRGHDRREGRRESQGDPHERYAGQWRLRTQQTANCRLTLGLESHMGDRRVQVMGCFGPGDLWKAMSWRAVPGGVVIFQAGGGQLIELRGSGQQLTGRAGDQTVSLVR